jgi:hypothetical protein
VTEHHIRLRGGWECVPCGGPAIARNRLTLPTRWLAREPCRLRLIRRFHRPPAGAVSRIFLRLENVPGIHSLMINGQTLAGISPDLARYDIPLDELTDRNVLEIEIETPAPGASSDGHEPAWGEVALVICDRVSRFPP